MKKRITYLGTLILVIICFSCKTSHVLESSTSNEKSPKTEVNNISITEFSFDWLNAKVSAYVYGYQVNGQLKVRKDSVLWLSLNKFGFEFVRLKATQDSLFIFNRAEKKYYTGNYDFITDKIGVKVNYNILESLLLGNDFKCFDTTSYSFTEAEQSFDFVYKNRTTNKQCGNIQKTKLNQTLSVNKLNFRIIKNILTDIGTNQELQVSYSNFPKAGNALLAAQVYILIPAMPQLDIIEINYSDLNLGKPQTFPFNIPNSATRMN